ncbi:unnamed protein product [Ceratitis capitata]|uniref:(Mediterranean fruit fly) hypothetical protein n=1 Tax=Ceratitis capitata TaxID=7213 RepID=A0A811U1T4_CERCA|nr:unnamed protein product [Ceratitis capitata]
MLKEYHRDMTGSAGDSRQKYGIWLLALHLPKYSSIPSKEFTLTVLQKYLPYGHIWPYSNSSFLTRDLLTSLELKSKLIPSGTLAPRIDLLIWPTQNKELNSESIYRYVYKHIKLYLSGCWLVRWLVGTWWTLCHSRFKLRIN